MDVNAVVQEIISDVIDTVRVAVESDGMLEYAQTVTEIAGDYVANHCHSPRPFL